MLSVIEAEPLPDDELELRIGLMRATWAFFDDASESVAAPLTKGPRGGGREGEQIARHVYASERHNFWRKVGIREADEVLLTPHELADLRERFVAAIREYHAEGRPARRWPLRFLIRRTAQHAMDHAWELEDRDRVDWPAVVQALAKRAYARMFVGGRSDEPAQTARC